MSQSILTELPECKFLGTLRTKSPGPYSSAVHIEFQREDEHMLINALLSKNQIFPLTLLVCLLLWACFCATNTLRKKKTLIEKNPKISKAEGRNIFQSRKSQLESHLMSADLSEFKVISTFLHLILPFL